MPAPRRLFSRTPTVLRPPARGCRSRLPREVGQSKFMNSKGVPAWVRSVAGYGGRNHFVVRDPWASRPRVGVRPSHQPWAEGRNTVGVRIHDAAVWIPRLPSARARFIDGQKKAAGAPTPTAKLNNSNTARFDSRLAVRLTTAVHPYMKTRTSVRSSAAFDSTRVAAFNNHLTEVLAAARRADRGLHFAGG